jgi:hypothetical protein
MKSGLRAEGGWNWPKTVHNCGFPFSDIELSGCAFIINKGTILAPH